MEPKSMKIMKNDALGASGGLWGSHRSQNGCWTATRLRKGCHFNGKVKFWVDKGAHLGG